MPENTYEDHAFLRRYRNMRRFKPGLLHRGFEWDSFRALLPRLQGADVLDLGCGYGDLCQYVRAEGAASALGLDLSKDMICSAQRENADPAIKYEIASLETFTTSPSTYDLVLSSLALHYVEAFGRLCQVVASALRPGGFFIFSCEHPIATAGTGRKWVHSEDGAGRLWTVDNYAEEGPRTTRWLGSNVVRQHRTLAGYVNPILDAGLVLKRLKEPKPSAAILQEFPEMADDARRPPFLLMQAQKPDAR